MAYSYIKVSAAAGQTSVPFNFDYLDSAEIVVTINDVETTDWSLSSPNVVAMDNPLSAGDVVEVKRVTDLTNRAVDFASGAVLTEEDLDLSAQQVFNAAQEALDSTEKNLSETYNGQYDAQNKRIVNLADPVDPQDAVTKAHLDYEYPAVLNVSNNMSDVNDVSTNMADINEVQDNIADINTVVTNMSDINTVATNIDDVITVANDLNEAISEVETVANDLNEAVSEIEVVAANVADVNTVGTNIASVNTVAGIDANVTTVAGISANVTTVAGNNTNVTKVANIDADVSTVANNIADVSTVADNISDVTNFADVYLGGKASDPTTRNDGSALQAGDLYFNTSVNELRTYSGSQWVSGTAGTMAVQRFTGDGATASFTLSQAPSGENNTQVYVNGIYQQKDSYSVSGTSLILSEAPEADQVIEVVTISTLALGETDASLVTYTNSAAGSVERTVEVKLGEFVSVKDFGAVGDGVTDDTQAFVDALATKQPVFVPLGEYRITEMIQIPSNTRLTGAGEGSAAGSYSKILFDPADGVDSTLFIFGGNDNITISSLWIQGRGDTYANWDRCFDLDDNSGDYGPYSGSERQVIFEHIRVDDFSEAGWVLSGQWNVTIRNCQGFNLGDRARLEDFTGAIVFKVSPLLAGWSGSGNTFIDNYFGSCSYGIYGSAAWNVTLINNIFEYCRYPIRRDASGTLWTIQACWFENNTYNSIINGDTLTIGGRGFGKDVNVSYSENCVVDVGSGLKVYRNEDDIKFQVQGASGVTSFKPSYEDIGFRIRNDGNHGLAYDESGYATGIVDLDFKNKTSLMAGMRSRNHWGKTIAMEAYGGWWYSDSSHKDDCTFGTITGATNTNPVVLTVSSTTGGSKLLDGDIIKVTNVAGMTELNDNFYRITVLTSTTIQLDGIDGSSYGTYSSGGDWVSDRKDRRGAGVVLETYGSGGGNGYGYGRVGLYAGRDNNGSDNDYQARVYADRDAFYPSTDNVYDLGTATYRYDNIYATNGTIQTSDERAKQDIEALTSAEQQVAVSLKGMIKRFRFKDSVERKGDDARIHVGVIAQEVQAAFVAQGLNPEHYGIFCYDSWYEVDGVQVPVEEGDTPPENAVMVDRYGIRYEELLAFIISAM